MEPIYQSGIAGGIFYLIVSVLPIYSVKDIKLHLIHNNLTDIISELKEDVARIAKDFEDENKNNISGSKQLSDAAKSYLILGGNKVSVLTDSIMSMLDMLPVSDMKLFNKIFMTQAYRRVYYHQYDEEFTKVDIDNLLNSLNKVVKDLENLRDNIEKL